MAKVILNIEGDARDAYKKIADLESYAKKMPPITIKVKMDGLDKASKDVLAVAKAQAQASIEADRLARANRQAESDTRKYAIQAERTRTAEQNRLLETQRQERALTTLATQQEKTRTATQQYATQTEKTRTAEVNRAAAADKARAALSNLRGEQDRTATSSGNLLNSIHQIGDAYSKLWSRITSTVTRRLINQAFTALRSTIKDTLDVMKDVDTQLINIQKVSGKTSEEIAAIGERAYDTAAKYGVAVEDYLSAVYSFQKAGLGESAESLAELATKTMLVGDTTAAVAEKFLISSNAAWELHGNIDELNKVIDQADYINNNYATTLDKIAAGLPIVASVAANAGMTYSETMAALGTIQSITQESGTKSATALRALILNIEKEAGTYLTEEGEEFEVTAESIKGLQGLLEKYAATEMEAARASGELLNPMTAIKALFEGMQNSDVTDIELFQLLSAMGGKLRTNQLTALVKNFDMFDEMLQRIGNSAGTADNEVELMMQSWEKKSQVLKDRWQQFIAQLVSTDAIKGLIDDITEFVVNLDPAAIGAAIRDTLYPILDFIKNVDWAGAAKHISEIFDKIMAVGKGTAIAATIGAVIGGLEKVFSLIRNIGGLLGNLGGLFGVGGVGAIAGGGLIGGLGLIFGSIAVGAAEFYGKLNKVTEATRNLNDVVRDSERAYKATTDQVDATSAVAQMYIDKLEVLESQGKLTNDQQDEYHRYLERLTQILPEVAGLIDLENDKIEGGIPALKERASAWAEEAKAAAYSAMVADQAAAVVKAQIEAQINTKKYEDAEAIVKDYEEAIAKISSEMEGLGPLYKMDAETLAHYNELSDELFKLGSAAEYHQALADMNLYGKAKDIADQAVAEAEAVLADLEDAVNARIEEEAQAAQSTVLTNEQDQAAAAAARVAEQRRGQKTATQEAAQAEQELAQASTESGSAGQEAATITATAVRQDTIPAVKELQEELNQIPAEKTITLVPHFDEAISKIKEYISFLEHIKGTYTSTLTSTVYHEAYNRDAEGNLLPGFYDGSVYGGSGVIGRAAGGVVSGGGKTLVNELGPELISENGRAYIAGGGKPTVVNLAPGAIVIPADETAEALKDGMPRMAAAYAFDAGGGGGNVTVTVHDFNKNPNLNGSKDPNYKPSTRSSSSSSGSGSGKGSGSGSGSSASVKVEVDFSALEKTLADELKRIDAEAKLAENEGDFKHVAEMYEAAQKEIKKLVDQYRAEGYADDSIEILTLLNKNYDYANKQLKLYQDKWDDLVDALQADTDATKALKELEEKRAALEESVAAYENAQKQRTVRIYNAETGQWEWIADQKKIDSAQQKIDSAQEAYNDAVKKQAIEELKKMGENISDLSDIVLGPALSAVVTMSEDSQEFQNFAAALNAVFGVGSFLQSTEGTTSALSTVDSHDTHYSFGGVDITPEQAGSMTLAQLAQMLQVLKIT